MHAHKLATATHLKITEMLLQDSIGVRNLELLTERAIDFQPARPSLPLRPACSDPDSSVEVAQLRLRERPLEAGAGEQL